MGRHSTERPRRRWLLPTVVICLVLSLGLSAWVAMAVSRKPAGCGEPVKVVVAASPDIAPALSLVVRGLDQPCAAIEVQSRESSQVAESLAISDGSARPQAWIPDSTLALRRARQLGAADVPESGPSVASSPVVLAVSEDVAKGFGWPAQPLTWAAVLASAGAGIVTGLPDPAKDAVGVSALLGLRAALTGGPSPNPDAAYASLLRRFSANTVDGETELLARVPGLGAAADVAPLTVFPASENSVLRHNVTRGESPLVAAYSEASPSLDYPFVELAGATQAQRAVIEPLIRALLGRPGAGAIADAGLRAAGGQALGGHADDERVTAQGVQSAVMPPSATVDEVLNQWAGINRNARVQVLIDVSGSMTEPVAGTGKTRMQVTLEAAEKGMHLFKPATQLRILTFATKLDGDADYREVLPMAPVGRQLAGGALDKLRAITAGPDGQTGLYDSLLDTYRVARKEWEPARLNVVIVMTDGRNSDPGGISSADLLTELGKLQEPGRPIPVIGIGIGPDADEVELRQIVAPTGGQAFVTRDPAKIADVFYGALSHLARG
ncbi:VWA domain-containing protein [Amycolatopsis sp. H20-H5]|uniref:VWA domain-containing protein n=1 Tax=Amycolatopsis sp. H20-H5 TaxID=3046309 RepID=UPI002DBE4BEF|nr:VWA domain-containing protein [Amycolatopsis sp. H20-H5]MEC3981971.1 VWA domain-containing protein [Amycolatopsis sp. H20-H5]